MEAARAKDTSREKFIYTKLDMMQNERGEGSEECVGREQAEASDKQLITDPDQCSSLISHQDVLISKSMDNHSKIDLISTRAAEGGVVTR